MRTKEKLAAVGEMAAQLAHEIRNPLGSISGSAQVLHRRARHLGDEQERLLGIISRESKRLSDTLNRFLYQAASPGARAAGRSTSARSIEEAVTLLRNGPEVGARPLVEFEADAGPHVCIADPDQIAQVFWNLARNGLEAMPERRPPAGRAAPATATSWCCRARPGARHGPRRAAAAVRAVPAGEPAGHRARAGDRLPDRPRAPRRHHRAAARPGQGTQVDVRLPLVSAPVAARFGSAS